MSLFCFWLAGFCVVVGTFALMAKEYPMTQATAQIGLLWFLMGLAARKPPAHSEPVE